MDKFDTAAIRKKKEIPKLQGLAFDLACGQKEIRFNTQGKTAQGKRKQDKTLDIITIHHRSASVRGSRVKQGEGGGGR